MSKWTALLQISRIGLIGPIRPIHHSQLFTFHSQLRKAPNSPLRCAQRPLLRLDIGHSAVRFSPFAVENSQSAGLVRATVPGASLSA